MGYYSNVRFTTTKEGGKKIKELVHKIYEEKLQEKIKNAVRYKWEDDGKRVTVEETSGMHSILLANPIEPHVEASSSDGKYTMYGFDDVKWFGYNHMERQAYEQAFEECGEPVKYIAIGEDGATDEETWGDEDYDMPYVEAISVFDYGPEWGAPNEQD